MGIADRRQLGILIPTTVMRTPGTRGMRIGLIEPVEAMWSQYGVRDHP